MTVELSANSYGSIAEVAVLAKRYTASGNFTTSTNPTEAAVGQIIDRISATVNVLLAEAGFTIPVTNANVKLMLAEFVVESVSDIVHYINGSGRFYSNKVLERGVAPYKIITNDFSNWLEQHSTGLEALGASRPTSQLADIAARTTDDNGNEVQPLFTRHGMAGSNRCLGDEGR